MTTRIATKFEEVHRVRIVSWRIAYFYQPPLNRVDPEMIDAKVPERLILRIIMVYGNCGMERSGTLVCQEVLKAEIRICAKLNIVINKCFTS